MVTFANGSAGFKREVEGNSSVLTEGLGPWDIAAACRDQGYHWRKRQWPPLRTLWTFLLQVLHVGYSCRAAVALALMGRLVSGDDEAEKASPDPSAYAQARCALPLAIFRQAVAAVAESLRRLTEGKGLWHGKRVWLVDGSAVTLPDTAELRKVFGTPAGQRPGCGFPKARIVALFCWATGGIQKLAVGPWRRSELRLWRSLHRYLGPGELVLADRLFCTFSDIAWLVRRGCDGIFRLHQSRSQDAGIVQHLGPGDDVAVWKRPAWGKDRPRGILRGDWEGLPPCLLVRIIRRDLEIPGFRTRKLAVATTLLDAEKYPAEEIVGFYRDRWMVELRLRDIKITMGMDHLRCKKARTVLKELQMHVLAYNLIRMLMWKAAETHQQPAQRLSFKGSVDKLNAALPFLELFQGHELWGKIMNKTMAWIARDLVPDRPNRIEPRKVKKRSKYPYLTRPRRQLQAEALAP